MKRVLRTAATDEAQGWMKAVVGADDDWVLGFTMIGAEAGDVMATVQVAMIVGLPYTKLRDAVISHLNLCGRARAAVRRDARAGGLALPRLTGAVS